MVRDFLYSSAKKRIITRMLEIFFLGGLTSLIYSQDFQLLIPMGLIAILEALLKAYREFIQLKEKEVENLINSKMEA